MTGQLATQSPGAWLLRATLALALAVIAVTVWSTPEVHAQATRTWVSGVGDDANPCSRTAPCKTFAGAISKTATSGVINCLDPGGFGAVTITKSLTIDCSATVGGILNLNNNGVNINDSAGGTPGTARVFLRGLQIDGAGSGFVGVNFTSGAFAMVSDSTINGQNGGNARGIFVSGGAAGTFQQLHVKNTQILNSGIGVSGGGGIILGNTIGAPASGVIRAMIDDTTVSRNNIGIRVAPNTEATIKSTTVAHNISFNLLGVTAGGPSLVNIDDSVFSESIAGTGVHSEGSGVIIRMSRSTISGNNVGIATVNGGQVLSAGNNFNQGNISSNGVFTGSAPLS
jgi:hypothetical protein